MAGFSLMDMTWFSQPDAGARFEWGPEGARRLAADVACLVVIDVLSFTTSVSVAVERGMSVHPYAWRDASAEAYAVRVGAELAVGRSKTAADTPWSLSPAALRRAPFTERLVLPSPNGSAIAAAASGTTAVVAGCVRNATAVGSWLVEQGLGTVDRPVAVIAAGERWPDGSLRPALEDLLGAGAVLSALRRAAPGDDRSWTMSAEAAAATALFEATPDVAALIKTCGSGRELIGSGYGDDVAIAAELDACAVVPVLRDGAFRAAT